MFVAWLLCFWLPALVFLHITMDGSPATYHCLGTRYYDLYGIMIPLATPRDALCLSQLLQQSVVDLASLSLLRSRTSRRMVFRGCIQVQPTTLGWLTEVHQLVRKNRHP
jgi:hypothetical protein